jgi:adenylate cyclase
MSETAIIDVETAAESARTGDMDAAVDMAAQVLHATDRRGGAMYRGAAGTVLVTSLLARNAEGDRTRAQTAVERLASVATDDGSVMHELPLLRLRALLAAAGGDHDSYRGFVDRYRSRAHARGLEGHIAIAGAMT